MKTSDEKELRLIADLEQIGVRPEVSYTFRTLNWILFALLRMKHNKNPALRGAFIYR